MIPAPDVTGPAARVRSRCPYREVLVGWDGSADAVAALRAAAGIVSDSAGRVVALAVLPPPATVEEPGPGDADPGLAAARESFEHVKQALPLSPGARLSLHIARAEHPAQSLCRYAADHGFDLIVLGRHGEGSLAPHRLLPHRLGHVAESAARASRIPVLLMSSA